MYTHFFHISLILKKLVNWAESAEISCSRFGGKRLLEGARIGVIRASARLPAGARASVRAHPARILGAICLTFSIVTIFSNGNRGAVLLYRTTMRLKMPLYRPTGGKEQSEYTHHIFGDGNSQ